MGLAADYKLNVVPACRLAYVSDVVPLRVPTVVLSSWSLLKF
jgi:hypothetical protein